METSLSSFRQDAAFRQKTVMEWTEVLPRGLLKHYSATVETMTLSIIHEEATLTKVLSFEISAVLEKSAVLFDESPACLRGLRPR